MLRSLVGSEMCIRDSTHHVPASAVKLAIGFHLIAYALLQFVFEASLEIHFLHLYAILFFCEVGIMLLVGHFRPAPKAESADYVATVVEMTPWHYAKTCAFTLFSCVVFLYLLFSPIGVAGDSLSLFSLLSCSLVLVNIGAWHKARSSRSLQSAAG